MAESSSIETNDFHSWNRSIGDIMENPEANTVPRQLSDALRGIVPFDVVLVEIFFKHDIPTFLYDDVSHERHKVVIDNYLKGAFQLNPFYQAYLDKIQAGGYKLEDLAPDDFLNSEYYQQYYQSVDCGMEFGFLFPLGPDTGACVSVSRFTWSPKFSDDELKRLCAAEPLVRAAFSCHWKVRKEEDNPARPSTSDLHRRITRAMANFGKSALTGRECEITQLVLRGHSSKSVAAKLEISVATVNTHRHRIYEKLDITSQSELFSVFIDSLGCHTDTEIAADADPLEAYHQRSSRP